ncbi:hypothetical protein BH09MYX1_BH09MYX1_09030 [soil metagenome]
MRKLSRLELAAVIGSFMVAITINSVWRVRAMGAAERLRVEQEAEAGASDAQAPDDGSLLDAGVE